MSEKSKNGFVEKYKKQNDENSEKMFLINILQKMNFWDRNCNVQSRRGHENITKSPVNNNASTFLPQHPKTY